MTFPAYIIGESGKQNHNNKTAGLLRKLTAVRTGSCAAGEPAAGVSVTRCHTPAGCDGPADASDVNAVVNVPGDGKEVLVTTRLLLSSRR
jgi:hypothetical protein